MVQKESQILDFKKLSTFNNVVPCALVWGALLQKLCILGKDMFAIR